MNIQKADTTNFTGIRYFKEDGTPIKELQNILKAKGIESEIFDPRTWTALPIPRALGEPKLLAAGADIDVLRKSAEEGRLDSRFKLAGKTLKVSEALQAIKKDEFESEKLIFTNPVRRFFRKLLGN